MKERGGVGHQVDGYEGDATAIREEPLDAQALFRAHAAFVASFLLHLGTARSEVDDLVQEVFLVAHRKGGYVPGAGLPRTWLAAIALRLASNHRRARGRRREDAADPALLDVAVASGDPDMAADVRRSLERVQRALESLDLPHRAAFVLFELEGESCEHIAAALEVPVGTVYSRLHTARRKFLDAYAQLGADEAGVMHRRILEGT
jgi:RNA polymerase sigma-70 factor (ECF subfamily)